METLKEFIYNDVYNIIDDYAQGEKSYWKKKMDDVCCAIKCHGDEYDQTDIVSANSCAYHRLNTWYYCKYKSNPKQKFKGLKHVCKEKCFEFINKYTLVYLDFTYPKDDNILSVQNVKRELRKAFLCVKKYGFNYIASNPKPFEKHLDKNDMNNLFY